MAGKGRGTVELHKLEQLLGNIRLLSPTGEYVTLTDLLLAQHKQMLTVGESFQFGDFRFDVLGLANRHIDLVRVARVLPEQTQD